MANERVITTRNTAATGETPVWEVWFAKTVCDAVMMSDNPEEAKNIRQYVDEKIADLIGGAPETYDTLKEIADYIATHKDVSDALDAAIAQKADRTPATTSADGLMSREDKLKLDNVEASANHYTHPNTAGNKHIPAGGAEGKILGWEADGTAKWVDDKDTLYTKASPNSDGLLAKEDKAKLDAIEAGSNHYTHPESHPASMITQDASHRFVTDAEKAAWNGKPEIAFGTSYPEQAPQNTLFFLIQGA